jgi:hypothetical protein
MYFWHTSGKMSKYNHMMSSKSNVLNFDLINLLVTWASNWKNAKYYYIVPQFFLQAAREGGAAA